MLGSFVGLLGLPPGVSLHTSARCSTMCKKDAVLSWTLRLLNRVCIFVRDIQIARKPIAAKTN